MPWAHSATDHNASTLVRQLSLRLTRLCMSLYYNCLPGCVMILQFASLLLRNNGSLKKEASPSINNAPIHVLSMILCACTAVSVWWPDLIRY